MGRPIKKPTRREWASGLLDGRRYENNHSMMVASTYQMPPSGVPAVASDMSHTHSKMLKMNSMVVSFRWVVKR